MLQGKKAKQFDDEKLLGLFAIKYKNGKEVEQVDLGEYIVEGELKWVVPSGE